ncbi:STAS domain-containing protein [Micromonospora sp. NPDC050686]|uniref:STAS domain-containing protein n=1 Tax=Micromonospora sp. NPDC050686 TaxID=3154631 RepID=UPI0033E27037
MSTITFAVRGSLARADIPALCADLAEVLRDRDGGVVVCDVTAVARPDVVAVEALARLLLTARRHGWRLVVSGGGDGLRELTDLLGLAGALGEPVGQPEQREQVVGVEEVVDARDPPG